MTILAPHDMLCFALYSTAHAMQQSYKPLLEPLGLTYPQFLLMSTLWAEDGQTVSEIGEEVHLESNTLTPMLKKLEAKGFVTRERDSRDERQVRIRLTREGQSLKAKAAGIAACILEKSCLTEAEAIRMRDDIVALRGRLRPSDTEQI